MRLVPLAGALLLGLLATGCQPGVPETPPPVVDAETARLLGQHGLTAAGSTIRTQITIGPPTDVPWSQYLEVSQAVGLDFRPWVGRQAELRTTPLADDPGLHSHVLVVDGAARGAWLSVEESVPGILPLDQRP